MTPEALTELNRKIAVMEASKTQEIEARRIPNCNESLNRYPWITDTHPLWDWLHEDYRVKPVEPRRLLVSLADDGSTKGAEWKEIPTLDEACRGHLIEFIEITPEVRAKLNL